MKLTFWDCIFVLVLSLFSAYAMNVLFRDRHNDFDSHLGLLSVDPAGYVIGFERILPSGKKYWNSIYSPWNQEQHKLLKEQGILKERFK